MLAGPTWITTAAAVAAAFGALALVSGGLALFGGPGARAAAADAGPFVLWFNFTMGAVYIPGAALLYLRHPAAPTLALAIALATFAVFALFGATAISGTPFEWRTVGALTVRAGFWLAVGIAAWRAEPWGRRHG